MEMEELNISLMEMMFDKFWYANQAGIAPVVATLEHFLNSDNGQKSPSPYFDEDFYLRTNPDIKAVGASPFLHFCHYGYEEGRSPSPFFDAKWYQLNYEVPEGLTAFEDFLVKQGDNSVQPNQSFFSRWYATEHGIAGSAFYHFLIHGRYQGYKPNPIFDVKYLKEMLGASGVVVDTGDVYERYLTDRFCRTLSFSPLFDVEYFTKSYERERGIASSNPLHNYLDANITINPNSVFDRAYYSSKVGAKRFENELCDYYSRPIDERISANILFDIKDYFNARPDVLGFDPLEHYLRSGFREKVDLGCLFDNDFYREKYLGNDRVTNPLAHYLEVGVDKHYETRRAQPIIARAEREKISKVTVIDASISSESNSSSLQKGMFFHVFYTDLVEEMIRLANNVPAPARVFISTDSHIKALEIEQIAESLSVHSWEVRVFENKGRDISPFIVGYSDRIKEIDIGCHLHTKKSQHYKSAFNDWRAYLFHQNLGSQEIVSSVLKLFDNPKVGMVAPADYQPIDPLIQWGGNLRLVRSLVRKFNSKCEISEETPLELPSGSMFWFRSDALKPLLELGLNNTAFDPELGQVDGTLAHAIERAFFYLAEVAGYEWIRSFASSSDMSKQLLASDSEEEAGKLLPLNSAQNDLLFSIPEIRSFSLVKDSSKRKRINLIIPTSDKATGYAGVSEALRIFLGTLAKLGVADFDCRIIDSDIPLTNQYCPPEGFKLCELDDSNKVGCYVVDGSKRQYKHLAVRENDVFFASAWWTAHLSREILDQMDSHFASKGGRKFVYLIQDYESCFYPWSTKFMLAEDTYRNCDEIIPVFNTSILHDFFVEKGFFNSGIIYSPPINEKLASSFDFSLEREKKVLIYMRPHAERNCLPFAGRLVELLFERDPEFWDSWSFYAVGEDFDADKHLRSKKITVLGRLSLAEYAREVSSSRVGISFMVSPHPSYPPLEMAAGGMSVITNNYENKNLSTLHPHIHSLDGFNVYEYADLLRSICDGDSGDSSVAMADWFFGGKSNKELVCDTLRSEIEGLFVKAVSEE